MFFKLGTILLITMHRTLKKCNQKMGSPCLLLPSMPVILSVFCWVVQETWSAWKIVITEQKIWILHKPRAYSSSWTIIFQQSDLKLTDIANNVSKLDRYLIISYSSLAPMQSFTSFICKHYNFYYPTFFPFKICFSCTFLQVNNTNKKGGHHACFFATQQQMENFSFKWSFSAKGLGRVLKCFFFLFLLFSLILFFATSHLW